MMSQQHRDLTLDGCSPHQPIHRPVHVLYGLLHGFQRHVGILQFTYPAFEADLFEVGGESKGHSVHSGSVI